MTKLHENLTYYDIYMFKKILIQHWDELNHNFPEAY